MRENFSNLEELLDQKKSSRKNGEVTFDSILDEFGLRSFAPMILLAGVIITDPVIGVIPGVPTIMGVFVELTTVQLLLQKDLFWMPDCILKRSTDKEKITKSIDWLYKPATYINRPLKNAINSLYPRYWPLHNSQRFFSDGHMFAGYRVNSV